MSTRSSSVATAAKTTVAPSHILIVCVLALAIVLDAVAASAELRMIILAMTELWPLCVRRSCKRSRKRSRSKRRAAEAVMAMSSAAGKAARRRVRSDAG